MAIYNGTQKIDVSGVDKVYVGTQLVFQKIPVLQSITLSGQTTSRNRGQSFVFGGTVTAHYSNGSTANVTSHTTFSGYNMSKAGTYTVTASYTENGVTKTATYQLTVNKAWTQIWSGSKTGNKSSEGNQNISNSTITALSGSNTIRITFSITASSSGTTTYYNNNGSTTTSTKPNSPFQATFNFGSNKSFIVGFKTVNGNNQLHAYVNWSATNKYFVLQTLNSTASSLNGSMTVTKIERYY